MPDILQVAPNVFLRLVPRSPDCSDCDTCQITDKPKHQDTSSLNIIIPARLKRLAKRRKRSSSSESSDSDSGLSQVEEPRSQTETGQDKSDTPRLTIRIRRPLQHPIPVAVDDNSDAVNAQNNEEKETRSLTEPHQTVIATDDNSDDGNSQEKEEDSHQEDSSYSESSDDESEEEYLPPCKRQRRCLETISNFPSSPVHSPTSSAPKNNKGVHPL